MIPLVLAVLLVCSSQAQINITIAEAEAANSSAKQWLRRQNVGRGGATPTATATATTTATGTTSLIILGGDGAETDAEVFPANANCTVPPPLHQPGRKEHSLSVINDTLVACGGQDTKTSCISWKKGQDSWEDFHTLNQERVGHAAVVVDGEDQIILLGGAGSSSQTTGEIVKSGKTFSILNNGAGTCAVSYQGGFVMMGGHGGGHGKVDRYDSEGNYLEPLPNLLEARYHHACATFTSLKGEQGLLVAGGKNRHSILSSTELYSPSKRQWIRGGHLPKQIWGVRAAGLILTGGTTYELRNVGGVLQYEETAGTWSEIGKMKARSFHGVMEIDLSLVCDDIVDVSSEVPTTHVSKNNNNAGALLIGFISLSAILLLLLILTVVCFVSKTRSRTKTVKTDINPVYGADYEAEAAEEKNKRISNADNYDYMGE